jgi:hypothetical protein
MANESDFINLAKQVATLHTETLNVVQTMATVLQRIAEEQAKRNNEDDFDGWSSVDQRGLEFIHKCPRYDREQAGLLT